MDEVAKKDMYRTRLYYTVRYKEGLLKRADTFRQSHDIGIGELQTRGDEGMRPAVVNLRYIDDEGDADGEDREAIGKQIAEALEGHTLTTRLN